MSKETRTRARLRMLLDEHEAAAPVLREALARGAINGALYWDDKHGCGCVLGTVAATEGDPHTSTAAMSLSNELRFLEVENWAVPIRLGQMPDEGARRSSGPYRAAMLVRWIDEWEAERVTV